MFSRSCLLVQHQSKEIDFNCIYPDCQLSRFLCPKCLKDGIHKYNLLNNSHILDQVEFQDKIINDLNVLQRQWNKSLNEQKQHQKNTTELIKESIQEIQIQIKNIQNIITQIEEGRYQQKNSQFFQQELTQIRKTGFSQMSDQALNKLININNNQQDNVELYQQLDLQSNLIIQSAQRIQEWSQYNCFRLISIQDLKHKITQLENTKDKDETILTGAISGDLKYIISGGQDNVLKIWDYNSCQIIKQIQIDDWVINSKFTSDSSLLFIGDAVGQLYQLDVRDQFKLVQKSQIHKDSIQNIICINNSILFTSSRDTTIVKTDLKQKQSSLKIFAHENSIYGLDYHTDLNVIVSGSRDKSIKFWNGDDGTLILGKQNAIDNDQQIWQVLFIKNNNQLISQTSDNMIIWHINYQSKVLEIIKIFNENCYNLSLALNDEYIILVSDLKIRLFSRDGNLIREINHEIDVLSIKYNYLSVSQYGLTIINEGNLNFRKILAPDLQIFIELKLSNKHLKNKLLFQLSELIYNFFNIGPIFLIYLGSDLKQQIPIFLYIL